jgi:pSer/pThr/pTyr-binding forkhead associated (FHA) protein
VNSIKYYELTDKLLIGRNSGDIQFPSDSKMSGKHALISLDKESSPFKITIQDLESKNKTILNREEIPPLDLVPLKFFALIEIGEQQFIITETNDINLQLLDEMIQTQLKRPLSVKSSNDQNKQEDQIKLDVFKNPNLILQREKEIDDLKKEIADIEQNAKLKIAELDQAKEAIIKEAKSELFDLSKKLKSLQLEVSSIKEEQERLKADIEQKKKKIINLKDFNS